MASASPELRKGSCGAESIDWWRVRVLVEGGSTRHPLSVIPHHTCSFLSLLVALISSKQREQARKERDLNFLRAENARLKDELRHIDTSLLGALEDTGISASSVGPGDTVRRKLARAR